MKFIEKVILQNFQSHKNSTIEFDNNLNIIVGPSDSGKTGILRGIKWALYNDPSGDYFIREGESECSVTIFFSDNTRIKRYRNKNKNSYIIYDRDGNESKYEGFGTSIPEEVVRITGIKKILLDKDLSKSINISDQLEGAFLLSEKNSIKANSIGYLVGVDVIDDALRETLKDNKNLLIQKKIFDENINDLKEQSKQYEYIYQMNIKIKNIEEIANSIKLKNKTLDRYIKISSNHKYIKEQKDKVKYYLDKLNNLNKVEIILKDIELSYNKYRNLSNYNNQLNQTMSNKKEIHEILNSLKDIDKSIEKTNLICKYSNRQLSLIKININFKKYREEINILNNMLKGLFLLDNVNEIINNIENDIRQLSSLSLLNTKRNKLKDSIQLGNTYLLKIKNIKHSESKYLELLRSIDRLKELMKVKKEYKENKDEINKLNIYIKDNKKESDIILFNYKELLLKESTCPLCFSDIDESKADYIINQYK